MPPRSSCSRGRADENRWRSQRAYGPARVEDTCAWWSGSGPWRSRRTILLVPSRQVQGAEVDVGFMGSGCPQAASSVPAARPGTHVIGARAPRLKQPHRSGEDYIGHLRLLSGEGATPSPTLLCNSTIIAVEVGTKHHANE